MRQQALLVKDGVISRIEIEQDDSDEIHSLVGNWFTSCFNVSGEQGEITGFCDDEFLLVDPITRRGRWNVALDRTLRRDGPYPIGNPIVICGMNAEGEGRSLTEKEVGAFSISDDITPCDGRMIHNLHFNRRAIG